jgi:Trypsin
VRLCLAGLALAACAGAEPPATRATPIVGGEISGADDAVIAFVREGVVHCTGTLVAPRVVVTAAHCVDAEIGPDPLTLQVIFGPRAFEPDAVRAVVAVALHPEWDRDSFDNDLAFVRLDRPAPVLPVPMNLADLGDDLVGTPLRLVGYGTTRAGFPRSAGFKRVGLTRLNLLGARTFGFANDPSQTCEGDSGGPAFLRRGQGRELLAGVASYGDADCAVIGVDTRIDAYADSFVVGRLAAWATAGDCGADGVCTECTPSDPDCLDRCQPDDVCQPEGCQPTDIDCELSCGGGNDCIAGCIPADPDCEPFLVPVGGLCSEADDCLTQLCVASPDDSKALVCSRTCDDGNDCPSPGGRSMRCLQGLCVYDGPSPGSQGWPCRTTGQCRQGYCVFGRGDEGICAQPCGEANSCPFRFDCETVDNARLCLPDDGCSLSIAPGRGAAVWPFVVALLALLVARYSRRRP